MQLEKCCDSDKEDVCSERENIENYSDVQENCVKFVKGFRTCAMEVNKFLTVNGIYVHIVDNADTSNAENLKRVYIGRGQQVENALSECSGGALLTKRDILEKIRRKILERKRLKASQKNIVNNQTVWRPWLMNKCTHR